MGEVAFGEDVSLALKNVVDRLKKILRDVPQTSRSIVGDNTTTKLQVVAGLKFSSSIEQSMFETMLSFATSAEVASPGGFIRCFENLLESLVVTRYGFPHKERKNGTVCHLESRATAPTLLGLQTIINRHMMGCSNLSREMLNDALELAGFGGKIVVERCRDLTSPSVELVRGYTFRHVPVWQMNVRLSKPKVICIDGNIDSVAELHTLLSQASETKEHVLLIVRGLHDDVKQTLKVNYDRGTLRVIPIVVAFDLEGINAINDIVIATNATHVSSLKGDLISSVKLSDASEIESAIVFNNTIVLTESRTHRAVNSHVDFLRKKREASDVKDVQELIDKRIKCLTPNHVIVRIPDTNSYIVESQAFDLTLRAIKSYVEFGSVPDTNYELLATEHVARVQAERCVKMLQNVFAVVIT